MQIKHGDWKNHYSSQLPTVMSVRAVKLMVTCHKRSRPNQC